MALFHLLNSQQSITKFPWQLSFTAKRIVCQVKVHKITHKIFWKVTAPCRLQMFCFSFNNIHFKGFFVLSDLEGCFWEKLSKKNFTKSWRISLSFFAVLPWNMASVQFFLIKQIFERKKNHQGQHPDVRPSFSLK